MKWTSKRYSKIFWQKFHVNYIKFIREKNNKDGYTWLVNNFKGFRRLNSWIFKNKQSTILGSRRPWLNSFEGYPDWKSCFIENFFLLHIFKMQTNSRIFEHPYIFVNLWLGFWILNNIFKDFCPINVIFLIFQ